jgi:glycerophosphoryl diester phosphodiesterase
MFELDVCETKDNQLVVHHDTSLRRTTGHDKQISEVTFAEIPPLQDSIQSYGGGVIKTDKNRIPLLETLFTQFPDTLLNIELKTPTDTAIKEF